MIIRIFDGGNVTTKFEKEWEEIDFFYFLFFQQFWITEKAGIRICES